MDSLAIDTSGPIRRFTDAKVQEAVTKALATVPAGKKGAVVATATTSGARLAAMARLGDHWSVVMVGEKPWKSKFDLEAAVVYTW